MERIRTLLLISLLALPVARAGAQDDAFANIVLRDVDILCTSGTMTLQRVRAQAAVVSEDGASILGDDVTLEMIAEETGEAVRARCPKGRYYFAGQRPDRAMRDNPPTLDLQTVEGWSREVGSQRTARQPGVTGALRGDVLLTSVQGGDPVQLAVGERGFLRTDALYWSERYQRFAVLSPFTQTAVTGDRSELRIRGDMCATDPQFREWSYFTAGDDAGEITYSGSGQ